MRPRYIDRNGIDDSFAYGLLFVISLFASLFVFGCEIPLPPVPTPEPTPVVVTTGLRVLLVRETNDRLPVEQQAIFTSAPFRKFIRESKATLRVWDDDVDAANETDADFRKMLDLPRAGLPWIVVAGGSKTISQPLPKTVAEVQALIAGAK